MKSLINKALVILFLFISVFSAEIRSQNFTTSTLIDIPGNNIEYDISSPEFMHNTATYICWVNVLDSVYTVYLKQIAPVMGNNIVVASDSGFKSRPVIAGFDRDLRVTWQAKHNYWQVYSKHFINNQVADSSLMLDSLTAEPRITTDYYRVAWVENGNLYIKEYSQQTPGKILLDSLVCKAPDLYKFNHADMMRLLYEKAYADSDKVCLITFLRPENPPYLYTTVSEGLHSKNPRFGLDRGISFQTLSNNIWKSECYEYNFYNPPIPDFITNNTNSNSTNPVYFSYPIPVTKAFNFTEYFLAFESDSLPGNKEIFVSTFLYAFVDSLVNISKAPGEDYMPGTAYLADSNKTHIAILWEHQFNGKTDIWIAKDVFNPITGNIDNAKTTAQSFDLQQNYPNPFNPSTVIRFSIPKDEIVTLDVYNSLGQKVCELLNGKYNSGTHEVKWNAQGFASGIYFCRLVSAGKQITKKIVLMK